MTTPVPEVLRSDQRLSFLGAKTPENPCFRVGTDPAYIELYINPDPERNLTMNTTLTARSAFAQDKLAARRSDFCGVNTHTPRVQAALRAERNARAVAAARNTLTGRILYALGLI